MLLLKTLKTKETENFLIRNNNKIILQNETRYKSKLIIDQTTTQKKTKRKRKQKGRKDENKLNLNILKLIDF